MAEEITLAVVSRAIIQIIICSLVILLASTLCIGIGSVNIPFVSTEENVCGGGKFVIPASWSGCIEIGTADEPHHSPFCYNIDHSALNTGIVCASVILHHLYPLNVRCFQTVQIGCQFVAR